MIGWSPAFLTGASPGELLVLFVLVLVLFGPKRLPDLARKLGMAVEHLRRASQEFRDQVMRLDQPDPVERGPAERKTGDGEAGPDERAG